MKILLMITLCLTALTTVSAQAPPKDSGQISLDEMKKLSFLVGRWSGEGWMQFGPDRRTSRATESVQSKLGGRVFVIEGIGKAKVAGKDEEAVVHNAFAFLYYDEAAKRYRMRAFLANGQSVEPDTSLSDGCLEWGFDVPQGRIRYRTKLNEKGQWIEEGAISMDGGKVFRQFFEMTLNRID